MQNNTDCARSQDFRQLYHLKKVTTGTTAAQTQLTGLNAVTAAQGGSYHTLTLLTALPLHRAVATAANGAYRYQRWRSPQINAG
jgi:hypothetical protein